MRVLTITHHDWAGAGIFGEASETELIDWTPASEAPPPALEGVDAVMVFGGAMHFDQEDLHPWLRTEKELIRELLERRTPLLAVCLGCQLLAEAAGARPYRAPTPEIGWRRVELTDHGRADPLIGPLAPSFDAFQWHAYEAPLPPGGVPLAHSPACLAAFRVDGRPAWGVQFHAEVTAGDLHGWLDAWHDSPDAVATGQDPEAIRAESKRKIAVQNELGRGLAERFRAEVERHSR